MSNSRALYATAAIAVGIVSLALGSCSGRPPNGGLAFTPQAMNGGSTRPLAGDSAKLLSKSLGSRVALRVSKNPNGALPAPNRAWSMLPGTLRAEFAAPLHETSDVQPGLRLTFEYGVEQAARIRAGQAALLEIDYANGHRMRFVLPDDLQQAQRSATVNVPATLLGGATGVSMSLGVDNRQFQSQPPGPRYWDGKKWSRDGKIESGKKTVVLIHGIFSSIEDSFPTSSPVPCPEKIAKAGGYQQVLGWDYDWFYPPSVEGPLFSKFLEDVGRAGVPSFDIQAHSYGSLVTLSAVPGLGSKFRVDHVVTLGGPLPLRGTPLAKKENGWRMGFVLGVLDSFSDEPPSNVDKAIDSGMIASLAPNSPELVRIINGVRRVANRTSFVEAAGTHWLCLVTVYGACILSEEYFKKVLVDGSGVTLPWDGVVETIAAASKDIPKPVATTFPLSHVELQCHDTVIDWVGKQVGT
jgi:hypothetical protein